MPLAITPTFSPWTHTSDDSYIYQLSLVLATATVSFIFDILNIKKFPIHAHILVQTCGNSRLLVYYSTPYEYIIRIIIVIAIGQYARVSIEKSDYCWNMSRCHAETCHDVTTLYINQVYLLAFEPRAISAVLKKCVLVEFSAW